MSDLFPPMRCDEVSREQIKDRVKTLEFVVEALIKMLSEDQNVELRYCSQVSTEGEVAGCFVKYSTLKDGEK